MAKKLSFLVIFLINFIFTLIVFTTPNWQQISITNLSNPSKSSTYFLGIWFTCHTGDQANEYEYTNDLFYKYYLDFQKSNKSSSPSTSELISTSRIVTYSSLGLSFIRNTCIWAPWNPFYTTQKILFCTSILYGFCFLAILAREFGDDDKYGVTLVGCIFYLLFNGKINLKIYITPILELPILTSSLFLLFNSLPTIGSFYTYASASSIPVIKLNVQYGFSMYLTGVILFFGLLVLVPLAFTTHDGIVIRKDLEKALKKDKEIEKTSELKDVTSPEADKLPTTTIRLKNRAVIRFLGIKPSTKITPSTKQDQKEGEGKKDNTGVIEAMASALI